MKPKGRWQFWIDRGGTFTDLVGLDPHGALKTCKLLSENPELYRDAALQGIRQLMGLASDAPIPAHSIEAVKMGTTVATNALLERRGEPTVLAVTEGFGDVLRIGNQNRPRLFDLHIQKTQMLFERVIEIPERLGATGRVFTPLDEGAAIQRLNAAFDEGFRSIAILLMHGYRYHQHELRLAALAEQVGFSQISLSHQASALVKLIGRGDTVVADAYLSPCLRRYVEQVSAELGGTRLFFMQSNGGLAEARHFQGKDSVLSGPAGGIIGAVETAGRAGFSKMITFDMGGTSTDVAHYDGALERTTDREVAGVRLRAPMLQIHTVAAGGGSIVAFDGHRFTVGPESAGANPGPVAYGRKGPLTLTDCNLMLGRLVPECFPKLFGASGDQPLDVAAVQTAFQALAQRVEAALGESRSGLHIAEGCLTIAVQSMAEAIKRISVQRGYDVTEYALCCFGGAGGQLACRLADVLGMTRVFMHPLAGVLSAYGMGLASIRCVKQQTVEQPLDSCWGTELEPLFERLEREAALSLKSQGAGSYRLVRTLELKYEGTDQALQVAFAQPPVLKSEFEMLHESRFGFLQPNKALIVAAISVEAISDVEPLRERVQTAPGEEEPLLWTRMYTDGELRSVPVYRAGARAFQVDGPAILVHSHVTFVVEAGWSAVWDGHLIAKRTGAGAVRRRSGTQADPVLLEVFNNLFMSIAEQMGFALQNTSSSVNIKERLDFSCALFDAKGQLIANAPHMPVHLGSMSASVQSLLQEKELRPGDVYATNNPYNGGTHLPDITVVTPVFSTDGDELLFFTASRGHHADIGGISPGSMPPFSRHIEEEGALLDGVKMVENGAFLSTELEVAFLNGPYPTRDFAQNVADLKAQVAANTKGLRELNAMIDHYSLETVKAYMGHVQDYAEARVREAISFLKSGAFTYELDSGDRVAVSIHVDREAAEAVIDFSGTSGQTESNFNAPAAVCRAAVLYVFRTLVKEDIPMNEGCLRPLKMVIPPGCLLNPAFPAAVVAGNVETSQVVTDALYGALGKMAAAQGTMNNFTFGNEHYQYYETICGGAGAGPGFNGADAVHTHMTNSRITDPEIFELRYPVLLERFAIRKGSGGAGAFKGGDGVVRRVRFLEAMEAAMLSNRRRVPPFGLEGGEPGALGRNRVIRENGEEQELGALSASSMQAGDAIEIETPGGGGFGTQRVNSTQGVEGVSCLLCDFEDK